MTTARWWERLLGIASDPVETTGMVLYDSHGRGYDENQIAALHAEIEKRGAMCSVGVGDGTGTMFVHGSHEACKRVQKFALTAEAHARLLTLLGAKDSEDAMRIVEKARANEGPVVAWVSEHALRRVSKNDGVLSKVGFSEKLAHSQSELHNVPLIRGPQT